MLIRKITPEERVQSRVIQSIAFLYPVDVEDVKKKVEEDPASMNVDAIWGCFADDGTMVSTLGNYPYHIYYDGHVVPMRGIGGVASLPESRTQGGIRAIFQRVFEDDRKNGVIFSTLYPFSHAYYRQFGYELCCEARNVHFPVAALEKYRKLAAATARMILPKDGDAPFRPIYERYASRYNYAVSRDDKAWERMLQGDTLKAEAYRYILSQEGQDVAYCMFTPGRTPEGSFILRMTDYAYLHREALYGLFGFLHRLSAQFKTVRLEMPSDFEISALVGEPYDVELLESTRTMARIVDVAAALRLMRQPAGEGQYTLCVRDDFLPENAGVYKVSYGGGETRVERLRDTPCDIALSVQTLAQLCLGYMGLDMALLKPDVKLYGNLETLRAAFVKKPMFMTDRF